MVVPELTPINLEGEVAKYYAVSAVQGEEDFVVIKANNQHLGSDEGDALETILTQFSGKSMILDVDGVDYMNSAYTSHILNMLLICKENGKKALICNAKGSVAEVMDLFGFREFFATYDQSLETAFDAYKQP